MGSDATQSKANPRLTLVVAIDAQRGIGVDNQLPWHLPEDLAHFKRVTLGKPIVMGRKTFDSLPGILPGRRHIVITRDAGWQADGAERADSLEQALDLANAPQIIVFGGAQIYAQALPLADRIEWTEVHARPEGDTYFPDFDRSEWTETFRESHPADSQSPAFDFVTLLRKPGSR